MTRDRLPHTVIAKQSICGSPTDTTVLTSQPPESGQVHFGMLECDYFLFFIFLPFVGYLSSAPLAPSSPSTSWTTQPGSHRRWGLDPSCDAFLYDFYREQGSALPTLVNTKYCLPRFLSLTKKTRAAFTRLTGLTLINHQQRSLEPGKSLRNETTTTAVPCATEMAIALFVQPWNQHCFKCCTSEHRCNSILAKWRLNLRKETEMVFGY